MNSLYVSMLSAVSKMLGDNKDPKVQCAKDIVDKLVEHLADPNQVSAPDSLDDTLDPQAAAARRELLGG